MDNLVTIIIKKLDKKQAEITKEFDNIIHIERRGINKYYRILGNREDINNEWLEETIKSFYDTHLHVPNMIKLTYYKKS